MQLLVKGDLKKIHFNSCEFAIIYYVTLVTSYLQGRPVWYNSCHAETPSVNRHKSDAHQLFVVLVSHLNS